MQTDAELDLVARLKDVMARERSAPDPEWRNAALDDRASRELTDALRVVVREEVRRVLSLALRSPED